MTLDNARNVLGVTANTSEADTKKAYRRLALEKHPDKNNGKDEEFKKINEAYSILTGKQEAKEEFDFSANAGYPGINLDDLINNVRFDFDPFSSTFRQNRSDIPEHDRQVNVQFNMTAEEIKRGKTFTVEYMKSKKCNKCNGVGGKSKEKCKHCNGTGFHEQRENRGRYVAVSQMGCQNCGVSGVQINDMCYDCKGSGEIIFKERLSVEVREKK